MRLLLGLVPALLAAGCANVSVEGLNDAEVPREPHYEEHRGLVAPQHNESYGVEVDAGATLVNATLRLVPRASGVVPPQPGLPGAPPTTPAPAQLTLAVLDAAGRAVAGATVDPAAPDVTLLVKEVTVPGPWTVRVSGTGASGSVDGEEYGASYLLSIEVLYA
jgi:hypothetical protein